MITGTNSVQCWTESGPCWRVFCSGPFNSFVCLGHFKKYWLIDWLIDIAYCLHVNLTEMELCSFPTGGLVLAGFQHQRHIVSGNYLCMGCTRGVLNVWRLMTFKIAQVYRKIMVNRDSIFATFVWLHSCCQHHCYLDAVQRGNRYPRVPDAQSKLLLMLEAMSSIEDSEW